MLAIVQCDAHCALPDFRPVFRATRPARSEMPTDDSGLPDRKSDFVRGFKDVTACQTIAALGRLMLTAGDPAPLAAHASQH